MSGLEKISDQEIHFRLQKLVKSERKITHLVLVHISEMQERRLYLDKGYGSAFDYLTKCLGYSEPAAYRRLHSSRLLKEIPEVADRLEQGKINLSQLLEVQKAIQAVKKNALEAKNLAVSQNNLEAESDLVVQKKSGPKEISAELTKAIIDKLENKNSFETKKIIAKELNLPIDRQNKINPQKDESVTVTLNFSKKQYELLKMAQSLVSHSCPNNSLQEVITYLAEKVVKKSTTFGRNAESIESITKLANAFTADSEKNKSKTAISTTNKMTAKKAASVSTSLLTTAEYESGSGATANSNSALAPVPGPVTESLSTLTSISQSLLVSTTASAVSTESAIVSTTTNVCSISKNEKAKTSSISDQTTTQRLVATKKSEAKSNRKPRKYISKLIKLSLLNRSQHQCEFVDSRTNKRCHSNYQLQIDHIHPHALGGSDHISNLRILCGAHNRV